MYMNIHSHCDHRAYRWEGCKEAKTRSKMGVTQQVSLEHTSAKLTKQVNPKDRMWVKKDRTKDPTLCGSIYMKLKINEQSQINGSLWGYRWGGDRRRSLLGAGNILYLALGGVTCMCMCVKICQAAHLKFKPRRFWKKVGSTCEKLPPHLDHSCRGRNHLMQWPSRTQESVDRLQLPGLEGKL